MAAEEHSTDLFTVRRVPLTRPFTWVRDGWNDLLHHRAASLAYGILVSALGMLIFAYSRHPFYVAAVTVGFLLVGPILTAGCCELSRRRDEGEPADFQSSLEPLSRARGSLLGVAGTLVVLALVWLGLSGSIYFNFVGDIAPGLSSTVWGDVMQHLSMAQLLAYAAVGLVLCAAVFTLSVVAVPMIVERDVQASTAMGTSVRVALGNLSALLVWAAVIVILVLFGVLTGLIGLIFVFPLLGHATWRAYKEMVE